MNQVIAILAPEVASRNSIKKWRQRQEVPHRYRLPLMDLAKKRGVRLTIEDFNWQNAPKKRAKAAA